MVQPAEHGHLNDRTGGRRMTESPRSILAQRLVKTSIVEIGNVLGKDRGQVAFIEHYNLIETLSTYTAKKPLAHSVHVRSANCGLDDASADGSGRAIELGAERSSRSRMIKRCPSPNGVAFRICCAVH